MRKDKHLSIENTDEQERKMAEADLDYEMIMYDINIESRLKDIVNENEDHHRIYESDVINLFNEILPLIVKNIKDQLKK